MIFLIPIQADGQKVHRVDQILGPFEDLGEGQEFINGRLPHRQRFEFPLNYIVLESDKMIGPETQKASLGGMGDSPNPKGESDEDLEEKVEADQQQTG